MYEFHGKDSVTARLVGDQLLIDAKLGPSLELKDNKLLHLPIGWDTNFDENALEIVNSENNAVFQLVYGDRENAVVSGIFLRIVGESPGAPPRWVVANQDGAAFFPATEEQIENLKALPLIFKYPAALHKGERQ